MYIIDTELSNGILYDDTWSNDGTNGDQESLSDSGGDLAGDDDSKDLIEELIPETGV